MKIIAINAGKKIREPENYCFMIIMMEIKSLLYQIKTAGNLRK